MRVFVDTSALYALLDEDDSNHQAAAAAFARLQGSDMVTDAYVVVETLALVSRRLGWEAVVRLMEGLLGVVTVVPVDAATHESALAAFRDAGASRISFVDRTSFVFMRSNRLAEALAFDSGFVSAGFEPVA